MKLYNVYDTQGQFDSWNVEAESWQEAKKIYCDHMGINRLLYVDRIKTTLLDTI